MPGSSADPTRNRPLGLSVWFVALFPVQMHEHHKGTQVTCKCHGPSWTVQNQNWRSLTLWFIKCSFPPNSNLSRSTRNLLDIQNLEAQP